ncbi:MAG: PAS domain S-box protein [candidate division Zixibacteria bacterium]|nr:PAS domain S-box protein [candidate division Zixibacteria bacterium]
MDQIRVLYIDDDKQLLEQTKEGLNHDRFEVLTASGGRAGLDILEREKIDVILCDLNMPQINGLEVLKRAQKTVPDIPFLIITAHGTIELAEEAIRRGAIHFVLKPFEIRELVINIHQALEHNRLRLDLHEYSENLEKRVEERTRRLEYANRQLASLNELSSELTKIFDEDTLLDDVACYVTEALDFDRGALLVRDADDWHLRSVSFPRDPQEMVENLRRNIRENPDSRPPVFDECLDEVKTILIRDLNSDSRWPKQPGQVIRTKAIIMTPLTTKAGPIGVIMGNLQHHERDLDEQDVTRFEMLANMVGMAVDNIRAYKSLERKVDERTQSLQVAYRELDEKARLLARSRDELQSILDSSSSAVIMADVDGKITAANRRTCDFFDLQSEQVMGSEVTSFLEQTADRFEKPHEYAELIENLKQDPDSLLEDIFDITTLYNRAFRMVVPSERYVSVFSVTVRDRSDRELGRAWMFTDITEMKKADAQLRLIVDTSPIPTIISRLEDGRVLFGNDHLGHLIGVPPEELVGRSTPDFYYDEDDRRLVVEKLERSGNVQGFETRLQRADGSIIWVILSLSLTRLEGETVIIGAVYDITKRKEAEIQLRRERNFVSAVLDTAGALVVVLSPEGDILRFNKACEEVSGYAFAEVRGKKFQNIFITPDEAEALAQRFKHILNSRAPVKGENCWKIKDGSRRLISWSNTVILDDSGEVEYVVAIGIDITEQRQAEDKLRLYREIYLNSLDGIAIADPEGRYIESNPTHQSILGIDPEKLRNRKLMELLANEQGPEIYHQLTERGSYRGEVDFIRPDKIITLDLSAFPIRDRDGNVSHFVGIGRDITERKAAEEKLRLYREIFLNSRDGMVVANPEGYYIESNPAYQQFTGQSHEENVGRKMDQIMEGLGNEEFQQKILSPEGFRGEYKLNSSEGGKIYVDLSAFGIKNDEGKFECFVGIGRNITDQKSAQEALAKRVWYEEGLAAATQSLLNEPDPDEAIERALYHLLIASRSSHVYVFENYSDPDRGLCARSVHEVQDVSVEEIRGDGEIPMIPYQEGFERWKKTLESGQPVEGYVEDFPENERAFLQLHGVKYILALPIMVENGWYGFIGFDDCKDVRDDTDDEDIRLLKTAAEIFSGYIESKRFEKALKVSERRFRTLVENANDVIFSLDGDGNFTYLSPRFEEITGFSPASYIGKSSMELLHPDSIEESKQWISEGMPLHEHEFSGYQERFRTKDGTYRWFNTRASIIRDEAGKVVEAIGVAHDITEMKQLLDDLEEANRELRDTQLQLVQSEKMASLGQLVAGIAHEINTPIGAVASMHNSLMRATERLNKYLENELKNHYRESEELQKYMDVIREANRVIKSGSERVITIVRRLRSFARLDEAELKRVDIHEGLEDTLTLIHHEIKHNIEVVREYGDLPPVAVYPGRLNQVFLNLLNNARQAIRGKGKIHIRTFIRNDKAVIEIEDDGIGIEPKDLPRVFDPGFTTKGVGIGTGLGLSICYRIIQEHHGKIHVESEPGQGTKFVIELPLDLDNNMRNK